MNSSFLLKNYIYKIIDNSNKYNSLYIKNDFIGINNKYLKIVMLKSFLNALKLNKTINTLKINDISLDQEKFDNICKFIENNTTITTFKLKQFDNRHLTLYNKRLNSFKDELINDYYDNISKLNYRINVLNKDFNNLDKYVDNLNKDFENLYNNSIKIYLDNN